MNQEGFISWIKNNSKWIISKFENLEDYKEGNYDLKAGDIIINSINFNSPRVTIALIDSVNIDDNDEWVSYFVQTGHFKKSKTKPSKKKIILDASLKGQPYSDFKSLYLMEMDLQKEYVVGNISETIKKTFLNWNQEIPWKKSSLDQ